MDTTSNFELLLQIEKMESMYKIRTCYTLEDTLYTLLRFDQKIKLFDHFLIFWKVQFSSHFSTKDWHIFYIQTMC
jgi:hypothetical protein